VNLGVSEIAILLCWSISILAVLGTAVYLITKRIKNK